MTDPSFLSFKDMKIQKSSKLNPGTFHQPNHPQGLLLRTGNPDSASATRSKTFLLSVDIMQHKALSLSVCHILCGWVK